MNTTAVLAQTPAVGDIKDIVAFGLLFVVLAALANGFSVTPAMMMGPLKENLQLSVFTLVGNFIVIPALVVGFLLAIDFNAQVGPRLLSPRARRGSPVRGLDDESRERERPLRRREQLHAHDRHDRGDAAAAPDRCCLRSIRRQQPSWWDLFGPILLFLLVPLVVGLLVRWRHPEFAMNAATWLGPLVDRAVW